MSEAISSLATEAIQEQSGTESLEREVGKISVFEALVQPLEQDITPSMTWQSAWSNKEDK